MKQKINVITMLFCAIGLSLFILSIAMIIQVSVINTLHSTDVHLEYYEGIVRTIDIDEQIVVAQGIDGEEGNGEKHVRVFSFNPDRIDFHEQGIDVGSRVSIGFFPHDNEVYAVDKI